MSDSQGFLGPHFLGHHHHGRGGAAPPPANGQAGFRGRHRPLLAADPDPRRRLAAHRQRFPEHRRAAAPHRARRHLPAVEARHPGPEDLELRLAPADHLRRTVDPARRPEAAVAGGDGHQRRQISMPSPCLPAWSGASIRPPSAAARPRPSWAASTSTCGEPAWPRASAAIDLSVIMGGITLRVPRGWRVEMDARPLLGGIEDKHTYEPATQGGGTLRVKATAILGGIEIKD